MNAHVQVRADPDLPPKAREKLIVVRDALRAVAGLTHDGGEAEWCHPPDVSRGDLAALFSVLGDQLEAAMTPAD